MVCALAIAAIASACGTSKPSNTFAAGDGGSSSGGDDAAGDSGFANFGDSGVQHDGGGGPPPPKGWPAECA